jgi:hypothetical protein
MLPASSQSNPNQIPSSMVHVGWAADGYPIFALWGGVDPGDPAGGLALMIPSYRLKTGARSQEGANTPPGDYDGTFIQDWVYDASLGGDLDECNGRYGTVTIDGQTVVTYHYFVTHAFPYIPRCFSGTPDPSFNPVKG